MKKNRYPITRTLHVDEIKAASDLAKSMGVSESQAIGCAVTEKWHRECAKRAGMTYEAWLESASKGEF